MVVPQKLAPRLTFGLVPHGTDPRTRTLLSDFCALLGAELGASIVPHRAPSPGALTSAIQAGRVQVAWLSPTLVATSPQLASVVPLVSSVREGVATYHAALFVADKSPVVAPDQLAGTRAAWVAPTSASGYLFSRLSLLRRGLNPARLFATETFYDTHGGVAAAVLEGEADVGASFAVYEGGDPKRPLVRAGFSGVVPNRAGRIIDVAGPIPADMIVAVPSVPVSLRSAITVTLRRIGDKPAAREPLKVLFGVERFQAFSATALPALQALFDIGERKGASILPPKG